MSCLCVAAVVDIMATFFVTFLLVRTRHATGYPSTGHVWQRLTTFAINTTTLRTSHNDFAMLEKKPIHSYVYIRGICSMQFSVYRSVRFTVTPFSET
ncbi:hypothetical protein V8E55_005300 [Tylopilus felleus]